MRRSRIMIFLSLFFASLQVSKGFPASMGELSSIEESDTSDEGDNRESERSRIYSDMIESLKAYRTSLTLESPGRSTRGGEQNNQASNSKDDQSTPVDYRIRSTWRSKYNPHTGFYHLTYSILHKKLPDTMTIKQFERGIAEAMCAWELVSNVRFKYLGIGKVTADVDVRFERGSHGDHHPFDGLGDTLAHAFYPQAGGLHFDIDEKWVYSHGNNEQSGKTDFFSASVHELGHIIGLGHSDYKSALMYGVYQYMGNFQDFDMPDSERRGLQKMYGSPRSRDPTTQRNSACFDLVNNHGVDLSQKIGKVSKTVKKTPPLSKPIIAFHKAPPCEDSDVFGHLCAGWQSVGHCKTFPNFVVLHCRRTCSKCPG